VIAGAPVARSAPAADGATAAADAAVEGAAADEPRGDIMERTLRAALPHLPAAKAAAIAAAASGLARETAYARAVELSATRR
jgi:hypothetical protein